MEKVAAKKQTEMIGLRVDEDLFSAISRRAKEQGVSPTSCVRIMVAEALEHCAVMPKRPSRRPPKRKPVSSDLKEAVRFLATLIDISARLDTLTRMSPQADCAGGKDDPALAMLNEFILGIHGDLAAIRNHLLGSAP